MNMIFLSGVTIVFTVFAEPIVRIFTQEEAALRYGTDALRFISFGQIHAYGMVMVAAFNGAGDTTTPTLINLFCYWLFQIPLAYWLAFHTSLGARRSLFGDHDCGNDNRRSWSACFPPRPMEDAKDISQRRTVIR